MEMSRDGEILTVAAGNKVIFLDATKFDKLKEVSVPSPTYTASLHQDKEIFVCGGEDLKLYKFDYRPASRSRTSKATSARCTACASLRTASCTPAAAKTEPGGCGRPTWARRTGCGSAW